ncbi:HlyU family transcriptional regulator [Psychromonas sp.]|uniref:HlyU family transcriptional regulator n=1 Tax=Psychromonas sp. TaxID=1884585 RepID=UPI0035697D34
MGFFKNITQLFTAKPTPVAVFPATEYKGFTITPQPMKDGGQFRVAAIIEKGEGEAHKQHRFIRSDTLANAEQAAELTLSKCKTFIDQMGDGIFR